MGRIVGVLVMGLWAVAAAAQDRAWIQIEARPSLAQAEARAADWDRGLDDVAGFRLRTGWYAIVLGPFPAIEAEDRLARLRRGGEIPRDAFLASGSQFREQFYTGLPGASQAVAAAPAPEPEPLIPADETLAEARAAERRLTGIERRELQSALAFEGYYRAAIDGAFGPGTRRSIEAWQGANRHEPTGFLTTRQRSEILGAYREAQSSLGLQRVFETRAGIEIDLPLALLGSPAINPPFLSYPAADGSDGQVLLISQEGDEATLAGLYDVMQTLEIVPLDGAREKRRRSFTLTGANERLLSHTFAVLNGGTVKGFTLVWPADDPKRKNLVLAAMEQSFQAVDGVLPDRAPGAVQDVDLLAGLEIRRPAKTRSGFYVSENGAVLTTSELLGTCGRITLGESVETDLLAEDRSLGLALLRPRAELSPLRVARLAALPPRIGSDVAVAGFPFGPALSTPTLGFGTLADVKGLTGNADEERLDLAAEPGDAGGPVFDGAGSVIGLLKARDGAGARQLPADVSLATDAARIAEFLSSAGIAVPAADPGRTMPPEDLTRMAAEMTVLVNCWE
ncbi:MAG: serine protease [Pseudomonadota bacterium]